MDDIEFISESGSDGAGRTEVTFGRGAWRLTAIRTSTGNYFDADTLEPFDEPLNYDLRLAFAKALSNPG